MSKLRILVVDDDKLARCITGRGLVDQGYDVVTACSGSEALERLSREQHAYSIVLLDRLLGDMSADDLIKRIRLMPHCHAIPIVMMTAQAAPDEYIACIEQGVEDFFYKPVDQRLLCHHINKALHWAFCPS